MISFRNIVCSIWLLLFTLQWIGCKKFVDLAPPVSSVNGDKVYNSDNTAISVLTTLYSNMSKADASLGISVLPGLSSDELTYFNGSSLQSLIYTGYYTNALKSDAFNTIGGEFWGFYNNIYTCNSAIDGLENATSLTPAVKQQLFGEAHFMRAFSYFYLVNLYGDVPLVLSTDYQATRLLARSPKEEVYKQIISDLKEAKSLLSSNYLDGSLLHTTPDRVRPTRWAAISLLARAYLYTQKWDSAEAEATTVINNASLFDLAPLNSVFLKNSRSAIWQLQPVNTGWNTEDARTFILPASGPNGSHPVYISDNLLNKFEANDNRKTSWINSLTAGGTTYYFPYKYKSATLNDPVSEYEMLLRIEEQYLIRAEARNEQTNYSGAVNDLTAIRNRAGLTGYTGQQDKLSLRAAILHERQVELFTEMGQRWLDLKRTGKVDDVMNTVCPQKGGVWNANWALYPIPYTELQMDPNLKQNAGY